MIIPAGTDYLTIQGSPAASYDFGGEIGIVNLQMKPVGPGNTNTIRKRLENAYLPEPGSSDSIPIEIVLISTENVEPFKIDGRDYNLFLRTTPGSRSFGKMRITRDSKSEEESGTFGGSFTSSVLCYFIADFTPAVGAEGSFSVSSSIVLETQIPGTWSSRPPSEAIIVAGDLKNTSANFHTGSPPDTSDFYIVGSVFDGQADRGGHTLMASATGPSLAPNRFFDADTLQPIEAPEGF